MRGRRWRVLETLVHTIEERSVHGALASILLLDDDGLHFRHGAAPSLPDSYNQAWTDSPIGTAAGACATPGHRPRAVIVTDIATDPLWRGIAGWRYGMACAPAGRRRFWPRTTGFSEPTPSTIASHGRRTRQDLQVIEVLSRTAAIAIEAKRAERQERLLVEELSHRVKNTLATAQSLATQTLRKSASPERFAAAFSGGWLRSPRRTRCSRTTAGSGRGCTS